MDFTIRKGVMEDMEGIHALVRELAEYERGLHRVTTTPESYREDFARGAFEAYVAESSGEIVGMALFCGMYSTWRGRMLYLEDFVVKEAMRGSGIGARLFETFLEEAKKRKVALVKWQVLHWNEPGINFYKKYPVVFDEEWLDCKTYFDDSGSPQVSSTETSS
jgi:GNAT superfamily N-acetyltransferase